MIRILVTDVFTRKAFDIISVISSRFVDINLLLGSNQISFVSLLNSKILYKGKVELLRTGRSDWFIQDLKIISNKYSTEKIIFIPSEEKTVELFYEYLASQGKTNFVYLLPTKEIFDLLRDKKSLNKYCLEHEISAPLCYSVEDIDKLPFEKYPLLLKPCIGSGSEGIFRLYSPNDYTDNIRQKVNERPYLVQELIKNGKDVKGAFYLYNNGTFIGAYTHERIRTSPPVGGVTVFSKISKNSEIILEGRKLLDKLCFNGLIMLEFLYDERSKTYKIIEANPRLWGSILLSEYSNHNLLTNYVNICLQRSIPDSKKLYDCYIRWFFPVDLLNYIRCGFKISNFWNFRNTCFINWTFSNKISSLYFNFLSFFSIKNIKRFFR